MKTKFKVGDAVIVIKDTSSHHFARGTVVRIKHIPSVLKGTMWTCCGKNPIRYGDDREVVRYVRKTDIVPVTGMAKIIYGE